MTILLNIDYNEYINKINETRDRFKYLRDRISKLNDERKNKYFDLCETVIFNCDMLIREIEHIDIDELNDELYILNFEYEMIKYNIDKS